MVKPKIPKHRNREFSGVYQGSKTERTGSTNVRGNKIGNAPDDRKYGKKPDAT
jgi:hypothetical protein